MTTNLLLHGIQTEEYSLQGTKKEPAECGTYETFLTRFQFLKEIWGQSGQFVSLQMGSFWWLLNLQILCMSMKPTKTMKRGKKLISLVKYRECHLAQMMKPFTLECGTELMRVCYSITDDISTGTLMPLCSV